MFAAVTALAGCFFFSGCVGADKAKGTSNPEGGSGEAIALRAFSTSGERIRTRRELIASETLPDGRQMRSSVREAFVQEVLQADVLGLPLHVRRRYELATTSIEQAGMEPKSERSSLEGSELEMTRRDDGVAVRVMIGSPEPSLLKGLMMTGFDAAFLPAIPVRVGDRWKINVNASSAMAGLLSALGLNAARNDVAVRLNRVEGGGAAFLDLDWRVAGEVADSSPMVFQIKGEMKLDVAQGRIVELHLSGGKTDGAGRALTQFIMTVTREDVPGWYR